MRGWNVNRRLAKAVERVCEPAVETLEARRLLANGSVTGYVYEDTYGNGTRDTWSQPIPNGAVYADLNKNGVFDTGEPSAGAGIAAYRLVLSPGTYTLRAYVPSGWYQSVPVGGSYTVTITSGVALTGKDFGLYRTGKVSICTFDDVNGSGFQSSGEAGIQGRSVYADLNGNGNLDSGEPSAVTDVSGIAWLDLLPGNYAIRQVIPPGWVQTAPANEAAASVSIGSGLGTITQFMGSREMAGNISVGVFDDIDGNGMQDPGERGQVDRTVYIDSNGNGEYDSGEPSVTTDTTGTATLTGVHPGSYVLRLVPVADRAMTKPQSGGIAVDVSDNTTTYAGMLADSPTKDSAVSLVTPVGIQIGDVSIAYALSDRQSEVCGIFVEYSCDGGGTWKMATAGTGGDGTASLTSSPTGTAHAFVWASDKDIVDVSCSTVKIRITPSSEIAGTAGTTGVFTVRNCANTAPTATVSLNTRTPQTRDVLTATAVTSDADNDPVSLTFVWKVNGVVKRTFTSSSARKDWFDLDASGNGDKGDCITVEVTPSDGLVDGQTASDTASIVIAAPVADVSLTLASPVTTSILGVNARLRNLDLDKASITFVWKANGVAKQTHTVSTGELTSPYTFCDSFDLSTPGNGDKGDLITVEVTPTDTVAGVMVSSSATVANSAPNVSDVQITMAPGGTLTLGATAFGTGFHDADSSDTLQKIRITSLSARGSLLLGGVPVVVNQEIAAAQLGSLTYMPAAGYVDCQAFGWTAADDTVYASGNARVVVWAKSAERVLAPGTSYAAGTDPVAITTGDFNGDGNLDLVVTNKSANKVSILLGAGDGSFGTATAVTTGSSPADLAAADFNGDGKLDLAVIDGLGVEVFLGNGTGGFAAARAYGVGTNPRGLTVADLNSDGRADLITANSSSDTLSVLLGNGDGTFGIAKSYATGTGPVAVCTGDLNGDGYPDLVSANSSGGSISVLLGDGNGGFGAKTDIATGGPQPVDVRSGDFDGDGKTDLLVSEANADAFSGDNAPRVVLLAGNGSGGFASRNAFANGVEPEHLVTADFNGDGWLDVAGVIPASCVNVLLGSGNGLCLDNAIYGAGAEPADITVGDLNNDGKPDVAVANSGDGTVSVLLNSDDFAPTVTVNTPGTAQQGDVTIQYTLRDYEADTCSIVVEYTTDGGGTWKRATAGTGGNGTANLTSRPAGVAHTFVWDSGSDLVDINCSNVKVRIIPSDASAGLPGISGAFAVKNHVLPTTTAVSSSASSSTYGQAVTFTAQVSASSGGITGCVQFVVDGQEVGSPVTLDAEGKASRVLSLLDAGQHTIEVRYSGDAGYLASSGSADQTVNKADQVIIWDTPATITYGTRLGAGQLFARVVGVAGGSAPGTLTYDQPAGTMLNAGLGQALAVHAAGTNNYNAASATVLINVSKARQTISWATPMKIVSGTALSNAQLNAVVTGIPGGSAPGALSYDPTAGTVLAAGRYTLTVTAAETENYAAASASVSLLVDATEDVVVSGTGGDDQIRVELVDGKLRLWTNGSYVERDPATVRSLTVDGGAGKDTITLGQGTPATLVRGGEGDDQIITTANSARDTIEGGGGCDYVHTKASDLVRQEAADLLGSFGMTGAKASKLVLSDADGDQVIFSLSGGGIGQVYGAGLEQVVLRGTTSRSVLSISVRKARSGDGIVRVGRIVADAQLKSLSAAGVFVAGDVVLNQVDATGCSMSSLSLGGITNGSLSSVDMPIGAMSLLDWHRDEGISSSLVTPWVGSLAVKGRLASRTLPALAGDLQADLLLSAADGNGRSIRSVSVAGNMMGVRVQASGSIGTLAIRGALAGSRVAAGTGIGVVSVGMLEESEILVGVRSDLAGRFAASSSDFVHPEAKLGSLTVKGGRDKAAAYTVNSQISAGTVGTVKLVNFGSGQPTQIHMLQGSGNPAKVSYVDLASRLSNWTWTALRPAVKGEAVVQIVG